MMSPARVKCLLVICTFLLHIIAVPAVATQPSDIHVGEEEEASASAASAQQSAEAIPARGGEAEANVDFIGRRLTDNYEVNQNNDDHTSQKVALRKQVRPLKNIFMGIYKSYKSTYLGNKTSVEYKQHLRERNANGGPTPKEETKDINDDDEDQQTEEKLHEDVDQDEPHNAASLEFVTTTTTTATTTREQANKRESDKKRPKRKQQKPPLQAAKQHKRNKANASPTTTASADAAAHEEASNEFSYSIGPGVNMSLDMSNDVVHVQLDGENLREIFRGHWLSDNTEQGRGKKYDMMSKVLPLFILPFLIQSAIVPFLVTKLKLLLMKSILVGKLAIFLLIISALRNGNKMQSYEVAAPSYWAGEPSRRSELAAAASSMSYGGGSYRVESKPAWIN